MLTLPSSLLLGLVVGVTDGVGGVLRAATAYHPSTLKTMCAMMASRCASCEQGHASITLTAFGVSIALDNDGHGGEEDDVAAAACFRRRAKGGRMGKQLPHQLKSLC
jgi:hypothetical protein